MVKREVTVKIGVFALLVGLGAALRIGLADLPNFAPVAALALFAGYLFRRPLVAVLVPLLVMVASDAVIGGYARNMMLVVYGSLALPALLGVVLRREARRRGRSAAGGAGTAALVGCSLTMSIVFFLTTNFATWAWSGMYPANLAGLIHCYVQALPFFRYTLTGDLLFACLLFGGHALVMHLARAGGRQRAAAAEQAG